MAVASTAIPVAEAAAADRAFASRKLMRPMTGTDVKQLQRLLNAWGLPLAIDGQFGRMTTSRVRSWERHSGRRINGRATRREQLALQASVAAGERLPGSEPVAPVAAPTANARIGPDGLAIAPADAPQDVKEIIAAANEIAKKPYRYGGGHARWRDTGYDCSGSMSYALHGAGLLDTPLDSSGFARWGEPGKGQWVTIYANAGHSYMYVAGLRFDTSGLDADGTRWHTDRRSADGYTVRHPAGL